jgi:hypothetical protein
MAKGKRKFPAKVRVEGRWIHIGDFETFIEASLARASAATLWAKISPHFVPLLSWDQEGPCK